MKADSTLYREELIKLFSLTDKDVDIHPKNLFTTLEEKLEAITRVRIPQQPVIRFLIRLLFIFLTLIPQFIGIPQVPKENGCRNRERDCQKLEGEIHERGRKL